MDQGGALEGLLSAARRVARSRQRNMSTAQVMFAVLQTERDVARIFEQCQVRERDLVEALRGMDDEPEKALEIAVERATGNRFDETGR